MFKELTKFELRLQMRNFLTLFFSLVFPLMMLFLFGGMYGNEPNEFMGGKGTVDVMMPAYTCMIVAVTGLISLPLTLANYREQKILKRFMATPLQPWQILLAQLLVNGLNTLVGMGLLFTAAKLVFNVRFLGTIGGITAAFLLVLLSVFSLGLMIAGIAKTGKAATTIAYIVYFPMLFLSGASLPMEIMPAGITAISKILPLTYAVRLMSGVWQGGRCSTYGLELSVLLGTTILSTGLAAAFFRWE